MGYQANYAARTFTEGAKQMALIRQRGADGVSRCACGCGATVTRESAEFDHALNYFLSRNSGPKNCAALTVPCHRGPGGKTARDAKVIAKVKRLQKLAAGKRRKPRHPLPCGRETRWKLRVGGKGPIRRLTLADKHATTMAKRGVLFQPAEA